jgi:mRNA interferase RelE/StbE
MKAQFRKQFIANLKGIKNPQLADEIEFLIELVESVDSISLVAGIKKLTGYTGYYRISIEDYRIGVKLSGDTVIFVCMYHRSVIYELFP